VIHVDRQPEPVDFDANVRQKGRRWLAKHPNALAKDFRPYWRRCIPGMLRCYARRCAYTALRIKPGTGVPHVDHFLPKSKCKAAAYEWSNYRLACKVVNDHKGVREDILDPFEVGDGWFRLELVALQGLPAPDLDPDLRRKVESTIDALKLNEDPSLCDARIEYYEDWVGNEISLRHLRTHFPFLAKELVRQGLVDESDDQEATSP